MEDLTQTINSNLSVSNVTSADSKKVEFIGTPSGDHECFCFDVNKKTFIQIVGKNPDKYDRSKFNKGKFRIYPQQLFGSDTKELFVSVFSQKV